MLHLGLLTLTFVCTTLNGANLLGGIPDLHLILSSPDLLEHGLLFSAALMLILASHEMGHYLAARQHRLAASLPYFIPCPVGIGTLGALIRIRSPIRSKRQLLDIGAAGPLAGLVALIPFMVVGIASSEIIERPPGGGFLSLGEPLLLRMITWLLQINPPPGHDLVLHPFATAAWFGMLITALNLLPFAQLDGGHIWYALLGRKHRAVVWPLLATLALLGKLWMGWWLWIAIILALRVHHPRLPDEQIPLDPGRRAIAWLSILVFALCFTPTPFSLI